MDERKRGAANGQKRRPQSIEKMRRTAQTERNEKRPPRSNYSDGYDRRSQNMPQKNGNSRYNIYNFTSDAARPQKKRTPSSKKHSPSSRKNTAPVRKTTPAKSGSQRRRSVQKKPVSRAKLRLRRFMLSFVAISVVILVGSYLSLTVWFKTENIRVEGETRYSAERILEACPIEKGENIFLADKKSASQAIKNALPYIAEANVRFSIPDTIIISVSDAQPAYQISAPDGYYAISEEGRILEKLSAKLESIPTVECSGLESPDVGSTAKMSNENAPEILAKVVAELRTLEINNITVIDITNTAQIKLFYDDRILIIIGVPENINYKLRTALAIINDKLDPNNSGVIKGRLDVSVADTTKKSYFNENVIYTPPSQAKPSAPAQETTGPGSVTEPQSQPSAPPVTGEQTASDNIEETDTQDESDAPDPPEVSDVPDVPEVSDVPDVPDVSDTSEVSDPPDVSSDISEKISEE